ncbi:MAG: hypothetical protein JST47_10350 [Bacteroidetes bacterium]|nr:hypothetical protein [Bacteroidota bacterium]
MKKSHFTKLLLITAIVFFDMHATAQNLEHIGKQKPFTFSGNIGGGMSFYHSTETNYTRDPFTWNLYGNFTPTIYSISLPFSFIINQYSRSYSTPFAQFGISPTYKWIKLDLGYRTISMSPFTFDGQSFKGVGIELTPKMFRFAAFYGSLNKAISEDTTSGHLAMPQYGRKGYGARIGVGNEANHFDLIYFHAKDDSSSIKLLTTTDTLRPQENTVIGFSSKFTFLKKIIWNTSVAASALTQDISAQKINKDTLSNVVDKLFYKLIPFRNGTVTSWAGQSTITFLLKNFNTTFGYRRVQADFKSLGVPYMLNDIEAFQWNGGLSLDKGKVNLNGNVNAQHNDVSKKLASELHTLTATLSLTALLSAHANLNISGSVVNLNQADGTAHISDSVRLDQQVYNIAVTPSFTFGQQTALQTLTPTFNYSFLNDNNPSTKAYSNSNTVTSVLAYSCAFTQQSWSLNGSLLYNLYKQDTIQYTSYGVNVGAGIQLLKDKALGMNGSVGYLLNRFSGGNAKNNITGSFNIHYTVAKHHSFSAYFNLATTPPSSNHDLQKQLPYSVTTTNTAAGISYNYSF